MVDPAEWSKNSPEAKEEPPGPNGTASRVKQDPGPPISDIPCVAKFRRYEPYPQDASATTVSDISCGCDRFHGAKPAYERREFKELIGRRRPGDGM